MNEYHKPMTSKLISEFYENPHTKQLGSGGAHGTVLVFKYFGIRLLWLLRRIATIDGVVAIA